MTVKTKQKQRDKSTYSKRVQTVLTEEQYEILQSIAEEEDKPISVLIREAIEKEYFKKILREKRKKALSSLLSLDAPVADWDEMKAQITEGMLELATKSSF